MGTDRVYERTLKIPAYGSWQHENLSATAGLEEEEEEEEEEGARCSDSCASKREEEEEGQLALSDAMLVWGLRRRIGSDGLISALLEIWCCVGTGKRCDRQRDMMREDIWCWHSRTKEKQLFRDLFQPSTKILVTYEGDATLRKSFFFSPYAVR